MSAVRRRELLAGLAGASVSLSGCTGIFGGGDRSTDPVTVETIDAPGSEAGTLSIPASDGVSFVEFFATTCSVCASQMPTLREAYTAVGDDVQFVSVTSQPVELSVSREEIVSWWESHDGAWPVALDDGTTLAKRYDATRIPHAVVIQSDGSVSWSHTGSFSVDAIVGAIRDARDGDRA